VNPKAVGPEQVSRYAWRRPDGCFLGARPRPDATRHLHDVLIAGLPFDFGASYRGGAAGGPAAVRAASQALEEYSLAADRDLRSLSCVDAGDLVVLEGPAGGGAAVDGAAGGAGAPGAPGDRCAAAGADRRLKPPREWPGGATEALWAACRDLLRTDGMLAVIGGDHSVSAAAAAAVALWHAEQSGAVRQDGQSAPRTGGLAVLVLDAHADLRDSYEGSRWSHACAAARLLEVAGPGFLQQVGVRSADRGEVEAAVGLGLSWAGEAVAGRAPSGAPLAESALAALDLLPPDVPLYLSVDIDAADPAYAPGVGCPEPGGCSARELLAAVSAVSRRAGRRLAAVDVTEVTPAADCGGTTAALAAKLVREVILARRGRDRA